MWGHAGAKRVSEPMIPSGKQHLGAALTPGILRAPAARQCPRRSNPSSLPTYSHCSHRYKKEIPSLPAALREGFRSWVGLQQLQVLWQEKVVSAKAAPPHLRRGRTEHPKGSSCFGVCIVFDGSIWREDLQISGMPHNDKSFNMDSVPLPPPSMNPPKSQAMGFPSLVCMFRPVGLPLFWTFSAIWEIYHWNLSPARKYKRVSPKPKYKSGWTAFSKHPV